MELKHWEEITTQVAEGLWAGRMESRDDKSIGLMDIDTVISIMTPDQHLFYKRDYDVPAGVKHIKLNYADSDTIHPQAMEIIVSYLFGKRTLVHCVSGCNRTTALCLCRLIHMGLSPEAAGEWYYKRRLATLSANGGDAVPKMSCEMRDGVINFCLSRNLATVPKFVI